MPDAHGPIQAEPELESGLEPALAPEVDIAPEASAADLETGLELGLARAAIPNAGRTGQGRRLPLELQARAIGRAQRQHGNFAVQRMLKRAPVQPFRRTQPKTGAGEPVVDDGLAGDELARRIEAASGGGQPIEPRAQARLEVGLQTDLGDVRVHTDATAADLADAVDAVAFTSGRDIFFGPGTYQPGSGDGLELLAHEAAHTVQQASGPVSGTPAAGGVLVSNPADPFEQAAEKAAKAVTSAPSYAVGPRLGPKTGALAERSIQREDLPKPEDEELQKSAPISQPPEAATLKQPEELV